MSDDTSSIPQVTMTQSGIYLQPTPESALVPSTSKHHKYTNSFTPASQSTIEHEKPTLDDNDMDYFSRFNQMTQNITSVDDKKQQQRTTELLNLYDTFQVAKFYFLSLFAFEHISFGKDYFKYKRNYNMKTLPPETQRLSSDFVVRTMYRAHLMRSMKFFPVLFGLFEAPYIFSGNDRWTPEHYTLTGSSLGLYWGLLTKRTPLFLTACTIIPGFSLGVFGYLEDLRGKPFMSVHKFVGKRRESDEHARSLIRSQGLSDKIHI